VETISDQLALPEIWETEEDKLLSIGDLKKKYFVFAKNNFITNPPFVVVNEDTN
jgi:hypothetical protein